MYSSTSVIVPEEVAMCVPTICLSLLYMWLSMSNFKHFCPLSVDNEEELTSGMGVASFYNRKSAQSPETVAKIALSGIKRGTFLITTTFGLGPILVILTRGFAPSESFLLNLVEALLAGPARIISYFSQAKIYWSLRSIHRKYNHDSQ